MAYSTSYWQLIVTLAVSFTVSEIWPVFRWKTHIFSISPSIQQRI